MRLLKYLSILLCVIVKVLDVRGQEYRPISDTSRMCLAEYYEPVTSEFLIGKWYYVYHFATLSNLPPSSECREILFERPTQQQLDVYKKKYNASGVPYTFDEDLVMYRETWSDYGSGLLVGGKGAKVFLEKPRAARAPADYDVVALKVINNDYVVYQDCSLLGASKWLISRRRLLTKGQLQNIIKNQSDLKEMEKQKFCEFEET